MLKVCHITSVHPRYDVRIFVKQCLTLSQNGYQVSLIVADELCPQEVLNTVTIYSVGKPKNRRDRFQVTGKQIFNKVLELNPDIVHFHDPELMSIGATLSKYGYKVIYDVHEDLPKQVLNKHWIPRLMRPVFSWFVGLSEKFYAKKYSGIITATSIIAGRFKLYAKNVITVHNYPLLAELKYRETNWSDRSDALCYIGSISETRGVIPLIESLELSQARLELAGAFSGRVNLNYLQQQSGADYVHYLGILNRDEICDLLQKVKIGIVTLLPTPSYIESLPIKMFEYMLAGIPIVASDFPLWREILDKYECGILVDPHDKHAIANACQQLLADQNMAKRMGENGRAAVLKYFNWEQEQIKLLDFYQSLN